MKNLKFLLVIILILCVAVPAMAGNGPGGGGGGGGGGPQATPTPGGPQATPTPNNGGGSGDIPDTGNLYGDLYVILRDENGVPILDNNGCIQPISSVTATDPVSLISAIANEPFTLYTYIDPEGILIECELTEEMATWVQGVDFGRLNLGRAPESVLAHAFDEAIKKMNAAIAISIDPAGRLVVTIPDTENEGEYIEKAIDSPAENLALYIEMLTDGDWITEDTNPIVMGGPPDGSGPPEGDGPSSEPRPVLTDTAIAQLTVLGFVHLGDSTYVNTDLNNQELLLAASLLAAAADKGTIITLDKVMYINSIYGINQVGSLPGETTGKYYFDFTTFGYGIPADTGRSVIFGPTGNRSSGGCGVGWIWALQPDLDPLGVEVPNHFEAQCIEILEYENLDHVSTSNAVHFTDMVEGYITRVDMNGLPLSYDFLNNVRGFTQAADDALQVIEYIHNYKVPEVLYPKLEP